MILNETLNNHNITNIYRYRVSRLVVARLDLARLMPHGVEQAGGSAIQWLMLHNMCMWMCAGCVKLCMI